MDTLKRIPFEEVLAASHILWTSKSLADQIALDSLEIINKSYRRKFSFFSGRRSTWIVGGLLYLLSYRYDSVKKQKELADVLGTTDGTIRDSYRLWLKTFPDLFMDVIGKFANDEKLRYFVRIDLIKEA